MEITISLKKQNSKYEPPKYAQINLHLGELDNLKEPELGHVVKGIINRLKTNLDKIDSQNVFIERKDKCLHDNCEECHGSGRKKDGSPCIHFVHCNCLKCLTRF